MSQEIQNLLRKAQDSLRAAILLQRENYQDFAIARACRAAP
ncbi:hypothetical protein BH10CHL1_BH10CHL1_21190 [soil metagenome]